MSGFDSDDELEEHTDNMTIGLQLQQFIDEWHFRVVHSNMADMWDRNEACAMAIELVAMNGLDMTAQEREALVEMDEESMVKVMVKKMDMKARKSFEHFVLQLQLVISSATRVRHCLTEHADAKRMVNQCTEAPDSEVMQTLQQNLAMAGRDLARGMEDGDKGITQQVLKKAVIEAAKEVGEIKDIRETWLKSMEHRMSRLSKCASEAEHAKQELMAIQSQLDSFGADQSAKTKGVLGNLAAGQEKALLHSVFSAWYGNFLKYKAEKEIHDKFRKIISDAEDKLIAYKERQLSNVKGVLLRKAAESDGGLMDDIIRLWRKVIMDEKGDAEMQRHMKEAQEKLARMEKSTLENNRKIMTRMSAGNDGTLMELCWQAWHTFVVEYRKNKEFEDKVKKAEQDFQEFMKKKSDEAKGVLNRMTSGSETGLIGSSFQAWRDYYKEVKQSRELEEMMLNGDAKFKSLAGRQKGAAKGVAQRANELENEVFIGHIFYSWSCEAALSRVTKHYASKMDQKKHQLDAVQTMFQSFAQQLEQGIGGSPRSQQKKKPPLPAA
jgi:hypothetical protein